jgi:hypothetical protein
VWLIYFALSVKEKMACLVFPTMPLSQSSAVVLWYDRQYKAIHAARNLRSLVRKRERREFFVERFTWCRRSEALRKQTPKNSFLLMVNDMNGRAERRID